MSEAQDCVGAFIEAVCVPLDAGHASATLEDARAILASDPGLAGQSIHAAAILGDSGQVAVKACVDSYWTCRRAADSVAALLSAGASVRGVPYPSGFSEVDALLESHGVSRT